MNVKSLMDVPPPPVRRRARWILLGVIGLMLASLGAIFLEAWVSAGRTIERETRKVAERTQRFADERATIPTLFEPAEEGNAWEPFLAGLKELEAFTGADLDVFPSLAGDEVPRIDDEAIALMLVRLQPALEQLKKAFRRSDVEPRTSYEALAAQMNPEIAGSIKLNRILKDAAAHCHRLGNDREALELLALGYWSSGIICAKGVLVDELVRYVIDQMLQVTLKTLVNEHEASFADYKWFGAALDRLEKSRPVLSLALHRDDLAVRQFVVRLVHDNKYPEVGGFLDPSDRTWLHRQVPVRIHVAHWLQWKDRKMTAYDKMERLPSWERLEAAAKIFERAGSERIDLLPMLRAYKNRLVDCRDMTLGRLAVALAEHGAERGTYPSALEGLVPRYVAQIPPDPWNGLPFRYVNRGDSAILYSLGGDGDDDGGTPVSDDSMDEEDGDVVWTIKRRGAAAK